MCINRRRPSVSSQAIFGYCSTPALSIRLSLTRCAPLLHGHAYASAHRYLTKLKPITKGLNRRRWFRLTLQDLSYYRRNEGELMAQCPVSDIVAAFPVKATVLVIEASKPFTVSGDSRMFLHCRSAGARAKWLRCLQRIQPTRILREPGPVEAGRPDLQKVGMSAEGPQLTGAT